MPRAILVKFSIAQGRVVSAQAFIMREDVAAFRFGYGRRLADACHTAALAQAVLLLVIFTRGYNPELADEHKLRWSCCTT
jgi:hypothetical protein